jgi:hypothetical protein
MGEEIARLKGGKTDIDGGTEEVSRRSILLRVCSNTELDMQEESKAPTTTATTFGVPSTVPSVPPRAPSVTVQPNAILDGSSNIYGNRSIGSANATPRAAVITASQARPRVEPVVPPPLDTRPLPSDTTRIHPHHVTSGPLSLSTPRNSSSVERSTPPMLRTMYDHSTRPVLQPTIKQRIPLPYHSPFLPLPDRTLSNEAFFLHLLENHLLHSYDAERFYYWCSITPGGVPRTGLCHTSSLEGDGYSASRWFQHAGSCRFYKVSLHPIGGGFARVDVLWYRRIHGLLWAPPTGPSLDCFRIIKWLSRFGRMMIRLGSG